MAKVMNVGKNGDSITIMTEFGVWDIEKDKFPRDYEEIYKNIEIGDEVEIDISSSEKKIKINGKPYMF